MVKSSMPKPNPSSAAASSASTKLGAKARPRLPSTITTAARMERRCAETRAEIRPVSTTPRNAPAELKLSSSEAPVARRPNCSLSLGSAGPRIG